MDLISRGSGSYELIDSGREEKLERFGNHELVRPDPQALWERALSVSDWEHADFRYERKGNTGTWRGSKTLSKEWEIEYGEMKFIIRPTSFKHVGLFPEQLPNWEWMSEIIETRKSASVLNMFAYTGGATMAAAKSGASVTHVDASKVANAWARENASRSGLDGKPIRWITEDALTFMKREVKRGTLYDGIVMDPPAFGHGPKKELWKIEQDFLELMRLSLLILSPKPLFVIVSGYSAGYSPEMLKNNLTSFEDKFGGRVECGELMLGERAGRRNLPAGIYGRFSGAY